MPNPVGEESWVAYLDEAKSKASDLEHSVTTIEHHKRAVVDEPGSLRIWLSYCDFFWSLWSATQQSPSEPSAISGWTEDERSACRGIFTLNAALELYQQGYEAIKYRIDDSHVLWDQWVEREMELLAKSQTTDGIIRITHLFRSRLTSPHLTWEDTAQKFSSFLTEYNRSAWEESMKDVTAAAQDSKRLIAAREPYETKLEKARQAKDLEAEKTVMKEYLDWEMAQSKRNNDKPEIGIDLCRGLYARALSVIFSSDEYIWQEYIVYVSSAVTNPQSQTPEAVLDILRRAVQHCPWSGSLWNRYILCAEEAKLAFAEIEAIKHAATSSDQLYKDGMESLIEMYMAWCGFLRRNAMSANAKEEAVDVADVGLIAALEDVAVIGQRLYGKDYQGDPQFRLERVYIQYLTEKKSSIDEARAQWNKLASVQMHADNHNFWLRYYFWEMVVFTSASASVRSPTPNVANGALFKTPSLATAVLNRAVHRRTIDWPEKVLETYLQHCNDYETPTVIRRAMDSSHKAVKGVKQRREKEEREKAEAYATYYGEASAKQEAEESSPNDLEHPNGPKRKRDEEANSRAEAADHGNKRQKSDAHNTGHRESDPSEDASSKQSGPRRDRENNTIIVENLPFDITQTKVRQYFKEYGHINSITAMTQNIDKTSTTALIEFRSTEEAQSALLRNGKYLGEAQLSVQSGHDLTVYVANYPPSADEKYIKDIFEDCGEILSVRLPSLKVNSHRRFCYVSFRDRDASAKAVRKDGTMIDGQYRLLAKYSDPNHKKDREGAVAEGREIQINNLDKGVTERELREVLSKYGVISRINIPRNLAGKNRGVAYVDLESKDQAQHAASDLNNVKLRNQIIQVVVTKEFKTKPFARTRNEQSASPAPPSLRDAEGDESMREHNTSEGSKPSQAEIQARTIALMGLPETVNDTRVKALVEPLGAVVQLVLQPAHGGAKIEFADAATAGRVALRLENMEFEGHKLRTGSLEELRNSKVEHKDDRIVYGAGPKDKNSKAPKQTTSALSFLPASTAVKRPTLGPSNKRGLGFIGKKTNGIGSSAKTEKDTETHPKPSKTNADFKAMLLTGGKPSEKADAKEDDSLK